LGAQSGRVSARSDAAALTKLSRGSMRISYFFEALTPDQATAIHEWSRQTVDRIESID